MNSVVDISVIIYSFDSKFEKDDHQMQKNQPILKQDTRVREMQDEIEKLRKENMNKDMQLQR